MDVTFGKRTAMNFLMLFATSVANLILVTGRRFAVKSVVGICDECEVNASWIEFLGFTFECQGEHPTSWKVKSVNRVGYAR
jgi:hypothetical protein